MAAVTMQSLQLKAQAYKRASLPSFVCRAGNDQPASSSPKPPAPDAASTSPPAAKPASSGNPAPVLPKKGLFAIADTKAEVYSKAGEKFDPTKKPGRYQPEFIWNTNWQEQLEREESLMRARERAQAEPEEKPEGFLSFSRLSTLDDMSVDLSAQLRPRKTDEASQQQASASTSASAKATGSQVFTRKESSKLQRVTKASERGATISTAPQPKETEEERMRKAAEEKAKYEQLKLEFQLWTVAFGCLGFATAYTTYGQDIAASYAAGAFGGLIYLRLLGRGVDGLAAQGLAEGVSSVVGQQRLLIPVILALSYNRWNELAAEQTGVTLQLLPMLVGFFTYKFAVIARQAKDVMDAAVGKLEGTK